MAWIRTIPFEEADDKLKRVINDLNPLYPPEYADPVFPRANNHGGIMGAHTLLPDAMFHIFAAHAALMSPELSLSRSQHEMISTVVSALNRCFY